MSPQEVESTIPKALEHDALAKLVMSATPDAVEHQLHTILNTSSRIIEVIYRYRTTRSETTGSHMDEGYLKLLSTIYSHIKAQNHIPLVLPAFPFKSPNNRGKVLGTLPDKAEEFALAHLNGLCAAIKDIYAPGAMLTIVSDGLVYNDLLSVPDLDVWKYGETLRTMARTKQFEHLQFARSNDLLHINTSESMTEMTYMDNVSRYRSSLIEKFGQPDWDVSKEISKEGDTCLTYRGYIKFLMTDLEHVYPLGPARSKKEFKRSLEHIAKQMLCRGQAFAQAVRDKFPNHVRLSIHPSIEQSKIPISLLPTDTSFTTPWHCAVAFALDGSLTSGHRATFDADPNYKLVYDDQNMASHYVQKEVLSLLDWKASMPRLIAEPQYPCGWLIRPSGDAALSLSDIDSKKIRVLAEHNSPVILRGFTGTNDRESFIAKAHDLGKPVPWVYGLLLEVKDRGVDGRGMNNTLTAERMPFHYDGVFKTKTTPDGDVVPDPPRLQFFTAVSESTPGTGYTLFSASSRIWKHLPPGFSLEGLKQLKWSVKTTAWNSLKLSDLSLVEQHPTTGQPVLRYHEQWPRCKTAFDTSEVQIRDVEDATSKIICESLDGLLHDRRVCYWHCWERGDLLVSDNVAMLHTRTGFTGGSDRELWRIHID